MKPTTPLSPPPSPLPSPRLVPSSRPLLPLNSIGLVHHHPPPVVHSLLLKHDATRILPYHIATRNLAVLVLALSRVKLEERPDAFTDMATALCLLLARFTMFQEPLHLATIS